jgi:hypothetical protein
MIGCKSYSALRLQALRVHRRVCKFCLSVTSLTRIAEELLPCPATDFLFNYFVLVLQIDDASCAASREREDSTPIGADRVLFSETLKTCTKIGVVSMNHRRFEGAPIAPDIDFDLLPSFQGKGFASEVASALIS